MQSVLTPSPVRARFGGRLLLALALCACGGAGDADRAGKARSAEVAASAARAASDCPAPPAVDTALFNGPWDVLSARLREMGASFPDVSRDSNTAMVPLCHGCEPVELTIRPDTTTYCTTPEQLDGSQTRILGILVLRTPFAGNDSAGWDPIPANDSIFMFASRADGPATMVYRNAEQAVTAPDTSWMFFYCADRHTGTRPEAKWRPRSVSTGQTPGKPRDDGDDEDEGGTYGWMACASGCCQFYTPPPNPITTLTPGHANENAPDTVGKGHNQAAEPGQRPTWCPRVPPN